MKVFTSAGAGSGEMRPVVSLERLPSRKLLAPATARSRGARTLSRWRGVFLGLCLLALAPWALRAETSVAFPAALGSGVTVRISSPNSQLPHFGFLPVRIYVENMTPNDGTWTLNFQVGGRGLGSAVLTTSHAVTAPAGQSRETWVYVPVAQAGFATTGAGSARMVVARATITKTPNGVKVVRPSAGGSATVIEMSETTGEMTTTTVAAGGKVMHTNKTSPSAGQDVVYTIDPITGAVSSRSRPSVGSPPMFTIVTAASTAPVMPGAPVVTITPTSTGAKVKRMTQASLGVMIQETDFDTVTGAVTVSRTLPNGTITTEPVRIPPGATLGTETNYSIDPNTGGYSVRTRRVPAPSALPTFTVSIVGGGVVAGAAAAGTVTASTPVPPGAAAPMPVMVEIVGLGFPGSSRVVLPNHSNGNTMRPFAVSVPMESSLRALISAEVRGAPNISAVTVTQLPADWRIWSGFAGLVLMKDEFTTLDAARRGALRGWVGMGGQLYLVPNVTGEIQTEQMGAGRIVTLPAPLAQMTSADVRTALAIYAETPALPDRETLSLKDTPLGEMALTEGSDNSWVAIFLVVFAAIIGPVNLFAFAPRAKRHRLFWTTPALSLAGGIVLVVAIFLQDGIGGEGRRGVLVVLLPGQNQAAVFQEQAARTGFLLKRNFALPGDAIFAPLSADEAPPSRGSLETRTAQRDAEQGGGDWFQSRSRPAHVLRQLVPTRGRVERVGTAADGAPVVESSLATSLRNFVLKEDGEKSWWAETIEPGERVTLKPVTGGNIGLVALGGSRGMTLAYEAATVARPGGTWTAWGGDTDIAPVATLSSLRWEPGSVAFVGVAESRSAVGGGR